ncbi:hypothetical protein HGRIS_000902 [Hohenbuehelia grisea]|uniref:RlpA-like protein double-psi beta-barrel domain-containing protein n=1 Tax=Hohenbuehelia grisea TaxID=104357 RepID=A0ABR3IQ44_9AGAR
MFYRITTLVLTAVIAARTAQAAAIEASNTTDVALSGDATWYNTGLGACGGRNKDSDRIVALSPRQFKNRQNCRKHIKVHYRGKTVDATVVDLCPGCAGDSIDLSPAAFKALAPLDDGRIKVTWNF